MLLQNVVLYATFLVVFFVYCHFGETVSGSLAKISTTVYVESGWYNLSPRTRRHLIMIMKASQQPFHFSAFGVRVTTCSMENFSKASWNDWGPWIDDSWLLLCIPGDQRDLHYPDGPPVDLGLITKHRMKEQMRAPLLHVNLTLNQQFSSRLDCFEQALLLSSPLARSCWSWLRPLYHSYKSEIKYLAIIPTIISDVQLSILKKRTWKLRRWWNAYFVRVFEEMQLF